MATELLATADTDATSADITVGADTPVTVCIKESSPNARISIELKDDDDNYNIVGSLRPNQPAMVISGPGVYRLRRVAGNSCGAFSG